GPAPRRRSVARRPRRRPAGRSPRSPGTCVSSITRPAVAAASTRGDTARPSAQGTETSVSKHQEQIIEAANGKLDEEILGTAWGKPRGSQTAAAGAGVIVGEIGARWAGKQRKGAEAAGIELANPGAVAITPTSLVTMKVKVSAMGAIKEVTEVLSVVPLAEVESLQVKRFGLTGVMEIK